MLKCEHRIVRLGEADPREIPREKSRLFFHLVCLFPAIASQFKCKAYFNVKIERFSVAEL